MAVYYKDSKAYKGCLRDTQCENLLALEGVGAVPSLKHCITSLTLTQISDLKEQAKTYTKAHKTLKGFTYTFKGEVQTGTLTDTQTVGVAFMYFAERMILGDEGGTGKTVQSAGVLNLLTKEYKKSGKAPFRYLFVTEKTPASQIRDKLIKFTGEYVGLIESAEEKARNTFYSLNPDGFEFNYVCTHALLENPEFIVYLAKYGIDALVFDESSVAKSKTSKLYQNLQELTKHVKYMYLLNASVLETSLDEYYNQLKLLDPSLLPTLTEHRKRHCIPQRTMFGFSYKTNKYKNEAEFKEAVRLRCLARSREDAGAIFEDNTMKLIFVELTEPQKELMKRTTLYREVADYPPGVDPSFPYDMVHCSKLEVVNYIVRSLVPKDEQVMIFCYYKGCQAELSDHFESAGYRTVIVNGEDTIKRKNENLTAFNNREHDILITNLKKGVDLLYCNTCILYSLDPNPQSMIQAEWRSMREFDVIGKSLYMIVTMGKEKATLEKAVKSRFQAADSMVMKSSSLTGKLLSGGAENILFYQIDED